MSISLSIDKFPRQQIPESQKTDDWYKKNADAGIIIAEFDSLSGIRETRRNKLINYNLANNKLEESDVEKTLNPFNIRGFDFPIKPINFPIIMSRIDWLVGKELSRPFKPVAKVINEDAISDREEMIKNQLLSFITNKIMQQSFDEKQSEYELSKLNKWAKWEAQDFRERMCNQILSYHRVIDKWDEKWSRGFKDLLLSSEEIFRIDVLGNEPVMLKVNPLSITTLRAGESWKIEDADIIIQQDFFPTGGVIDMYYDYLTAAQIKDIDTAFKSNVSAANSLFQYQNVNSAISMSSFAEQFGIGTIMESNLIGRKYFGGAYDSEGNVRVVRVCWKGRRKVGIVSWYDRNGLLNKKVVEEHYKANTDIGEEVKWYWINEWYETTRIADDIYIKMQPCAVNNYGMDSLRLKTAPYVGTIMNINSNRAMSMMDRGRPWQYLYNFFMHRLIKLYLKNKGKMPVLDVARVPDNWEVDKWLYYGEEMGYFVIDSFKEGLKGAATGKLSGQMAGHESVLNLELTNTIQTSIGMLQYIEDRVADVTGVTKQALGSIDQRELVGNVEKSISMTSVNVEEWFRIHEDTKIRCCEMFVEVAKTVYRNSTIKRNFILDDMTTAVLDIDGSAFSEAEYGIYYINSTRLENIKESFERNIALGLQSDKITFSQAMDIVSTDDPISMRRKIEQYEEESLQRAMENQQNQIKAQQDIEQKKIDLELEKMDRNDMNEQLNREKDIHVAEIKALSYSRNTDVDQDNIPDVLETGKLALEQSRASYDAVIKERELSNKRKESDDKIAIERKKLQQKDEELKIKREEIKSKEKIEQLKARTALKNKTSGEK